MMKPFSRGVALIEALVAVAVMAFGLLALAGVQATLSHNADTARQRSEAVRIAQQTLETWRGFDALATGGGAAIAFSDLVSATDTVTDQLDISGTGGSSTSFTRTVTVTDTAAAVMNPFKTVRVEVSWTDRANQTQSVSLATMIQGALPALAGLVSVPSAGNPTLQPKWRNSAIPLKAVPYGQSQSAFRPPQNTAGYATVWLINNTTGLITTCLTTASTTDDVNSGNVSYCDNTLTSQLVTGYVNFADASVAATAQEAVTPTGMPVGVHVEIHQTFPSDAFLQSGSGCFTDAPVTGQSYVAYFCAVPISTAVGDEPVWSGSSYVVDTPSGLGSCRYTRYRDNRTVGEGSIQNAEHPYEYVKVNGPLAGQNFLVVRAAGGPPAADADCPTGSPLPESTTTFPQHPPG